MRKVACNAEDTAAYQCRPGSHCERINTERGSGSAAAQSANAKKANRQINVRRSTSAATYLVLVFRHIEDVSYRQLLPIKKFGSR